MPRRPLNGAHASEAAQAAALGISRARVRALRQRGMPASIGESIRWRAANLDPSWPANPTPGTITTSRVVRRPELSIPELLELAHGIAGILAELDADLNVGCRHLLSVLVRLPGGTIHELRLAPRVAERVESLVEAD